MKMYNFILGAGIMLLAASCESSRQTTINDETTAAGTPAVQPEASIATPPSTVVMTTTPAPASAASATQPTSGNAITVSGSTMANSTLNNTTRDTIITPPAPVATSFNARFPKATNVKWYQYNSSTVPIEWDLTGWPALTNRDYAVMYDLDNAKYYAWYDAQGNWIGSTNQMKDFAGLPAPVTKMLSSKYAGYTVTDVHAETYKDMSAYQIEMNKGTEKVKMVVDPNGNVLKQKTKTVDASGNETKEKIKIDNR